MSGLGRHEAHKTAIRDRITIAVDFIKVRDGFLITDLRDC